MVHLHMHGDAKMPRQRLADATGLELVDARQALDELAQAGLIDILEP
jgi:hypothetical protein